MKRHGGRVGVLAVLLCLGGCLDCTSIDINSVLPRIAPSSTAIDFGDVYVGDISRRTLSIENTGNAPLLLNQLNLDDTVSFAVSLELPFRVQAGDSIDLPVQFIPVLGGETSATLRIESNADNVTSLEIALRGIGRVAPNCDDGNPCTVDSFDFASASCENADSPLNAPCDDQNACTFDSRCVLRECRGSAVQCPPAADACLRAVCDPSVGCLEVPVEDACDDDDPCTLDSCEVGVGCANTLVEDGTPCGLFGGCDAVPLCFAGVCSDYPVPEGSFCFDGDACTVDDACESGACVGTRLSGDMERIGVARSFGSPGALTAIAENGIYVFADPFPDGWRLTTVNPAVAIADGRVFRWEEPIETLRGLVAVGNRLLLLREAAVDDVGVRSILVAPDGGLVDEGEILLPLSRAESGILTSNAVGFRAAGEGDLAVVCSANHHDVGVIALGATGPSLVEVLPLATGDVCGDLAVSESVVMFAEMVLRVGNEIPVGGFLSRWTLGPAGLALETVLSTEGVPGCVGFARQIQYLALSGSQLLYSCALPPVQNYVGQGLFIVDAQTSDFSGAAEVSGFANQGVVELAPSAGGVFALLGAEQSLVCFIPIPETNDVEICSPPKRTNNLQNRPRSHGQIGVATNRFAYSTDLGSYAAEIDGTPGLGGVGAVVTAGNNVYLASQNAAHRLQILADGSVSFADSGLENSLESDGPNAVFSFGGGVVGPYLLPHFPDGRDRFTLRSVRRVIDATQPGAPAATFVFSQSIGRASFESAAAGPRFVVGRIQFEGQGLRTVVFQAAGLGVFTPTILWNETLDDDTSVAELRPLLTVHGDTVTALYSRTRTTSAVAVIVAPTLNTPETVVAAVPLEHRRPVSAAANGTDLLLVRGGQTDSLTERASFSAGRVEWFDLQTSVPVLVGEVELADARHVLWMDPGRAFIATSTSVAFIERVADTIEISQVIEIGEVPIGATLFQDKLVITTDRQVLVYSPPCPGL